ncbi:MAG: hypothetical protein PVJ39_04655 [Gammaproteobacteria bacterium]|jgi:hypothetical protein
MTELTLELLDRWQAESGETIAEGNHDVTFDDFRAIVRCFPGGVFVPDGHAEMNNGNFSHIDTVFIDPSKIDASGVDGERTWIVGPDELTIEKSGMIRVWYD